MDLSHPSFKTLFEQLGLASDEQAIEGFIDNHRGLNQSTQLADAPFWNKNQATFLQNAIDEDANWADVIDHLNVQLR
ncbi:DUF2789 domain-containing protein [Alteromonadaceae bacterium BrNp21-10]|nr:DUF2789 domain-containing protein [Alteromonadaceae bacterium BrNp21-10]